MHIASCVSSFGHVCRCKLIMTGRWLGRTPCFPLISRKWNAACGCTPLASLPIELFFPLPDLPCSVLVHTRRLERCQTAHAPIFGCVAVLVHSVDSGLMHGTVNKPPKSHLGLQSDMVVVCVPDIDTYIHVYSLDQYLSAFLALFPPPLVSRPTFLPFLSSLPVTTQYPLLIWLVFFSPCVLIGCLKYNAEQI